MVEEAFLRFSHSYLSLNGGLQVGWQVTEALNLFTSGRVHFVMTDEEDTRTLTEDPNLALPSEPFDTAWVLPVTVGARLQMH